MEKEGEHKRKGRNERCLFTSMNAENAVIDLKDWFPYRRPIKSNPVPIAVTRIRKSSFPSSPLLHNMGFQAAADLPEAPALADRGRGQGSEMAKDLP